MISKGKDYKYIIFDLDGTLSDPRVGIYNGLRHSLTQMNVHNINESIFESMIGPPLQNSLKEYFFDDNEKIWEAVKHFREYYSTVGLFENVVYEGIPDLLERLQKSNRKLFVATNKPQPFADSILKHFNLAQYFESIHGIDPDKAKTSKEELVFTILESIPENEKRRTIIIGDTHYDVHAGKQFDIDTIALTYGFGSKKSLIDANPTMVIDSIVDLKRTLLLAD